MFGFVIVTCIYKAQLLYLIYEISDKDLCTSPFRNIFLKMISYGGDFLRIIAIALFFCLFVCLFCFFLEIGIFRGIIVKQINFAAISSASYLPNQNSRTLKCGNAFYKNRYNGSQSPFPVAR